MKSKTKKTGFSIIELLTVMSIIMVLIGILVPSLGAVRRYARVVRQKGMFHDISKGLEMFSVDHDGYPNSSAGDNSTPPIYYCGAMKLCEAMVGQDGLGFHPDSIFTYDGKNAAGEYLYYGKNNTLSPTPPYTDKEETNLRARKKYLEGKNVQIGSIETLFSSVGWADYDANNVLLCDVFKRNELRDIREEKAGMPILYYRADTSKLNHDYKPVSLGTEPGGALNIYNYWDNYRFIKIKPPSAPTTDHPLYQTSMEGHTATGQIFYENTMDKNITAMEKPHNPDSYILISAGWDGLYGTEDDVFNFED